MSEFWDDLCKITFAGKGNLTCSQFTENWECDFRVAQLLNARIVVQVHGLKPSAFTRLHNFLDRLDDVSITGTLNGGCELEATNIDLSWTTFSLNDGDYFEGYVISPGFVEITHPEYVEKLYPKITNEVTNLSLGRQHSIEANIEGAKITLGWLPKHNDFLRYARGLRSARILSVITMDFLEPLAFDESRNLNLNLCSLLTLAQRSYICRVASHWQDADGITKKSRYEEPVFDYPPSPRPLIPIEALGNFVEVTLENYNKEWNNWKLPWAIDYYVQAMSLRHLLAQSVGFFTALETLKCAFLKQPGRDKLEYYVTKAGKLKRRAYKWVLKEMFRELNMRVDNDDLELLVALRNRIIHCGVPNYEEDPDMSKATNWTLKFSSLVEKTLLAILGYQGVFEQYDQSVTPSTNKNP
jgi:hypothetical protein